MSPSDKNISGKVVIPSFASDGESVYKVTNITGFDGCKNITTLILPNTFDLYPNAFEDCINLNSLTISTPTIYFNAFKNCISLSSVTISNSVSYIDSGAFQNCESIKEITIEDGERQLVMDCIFSKSPIETLYMGRSIGTTVEGSDFPSPFSSIKTLRNLTISNYVTFLTTNLFKNCENLTSVTIPSSLTIIGYGAFSGCSSLKAVSIPNSVTKIDGEAFSGCSSLTSITIPNSVTMIGRNAFSGCHSLTSITIPNSVTYIDDGTFASTGLSSVTIPSSITSIGSYAFSGSNLTSVDIPKTVKSIGFNAFYNCHKLIKAVINSPVKEIPEGLFTYSENLKEVVLPSSVETIGHYAFLGCSNLKKIVLPPYVDTIGYRVFYDCSSLESIIMGPNVKTIYDGVFKKCTNLKEVVLPPSVETIGSDAFYDCSSLESIIMGPNVKTIGKSAFSNNSSLKKVYVTAPTPPEVTDFPFHDDITLYLQNQKAKEIYSNTPPYWNKYDSYIMIEPTKMKLEGENRIVGKPGDNFQLKALLMPENVTLPQILWHSTNPDIATVDNNGLVTIHGGSSKLSAPVIADEDEEELRSCKIIAETLYANGPVMEVEVSDVTVNTDTINLPSSESNEIDWNAPMEVYNYNGILVGNSIDNLTPGFYIARQGNILKKIVVN